MRLRIGDAWFAPVTAHPSVADLSGPVDSVREAERLADTHLARRDEVERVARLVRWLDDLVRIPGTKFGIGLDAVAGFLAPGVGDAVTGAASLAVLGTAIRRGVPTPVLVRMLANIAVDVLGGLLPGIGDFFDLLWRSNSRNLALLERHQDELEPRARPTDWLIMGAAVSLVGIGIAAPFFVIGWVLSLLS